MRLKVLVITILSFVSLYTAFGAAQSQSIITVTTQSTLASYYTLTQTSYRQTASVLYDAQFVMHRPSFSHCDIITFPITVSSGQHVVGGFYADQNVYLYLTPQAGNSCSILDYKAVAVLAGEDRPVYSFDWTATNGGTYFFIFLYPNYNAVPLTTVSFWANLPLPPAPYSVYSTVATMVTLQVFLTSERELTSATSTSHIPTTISVSNILEIGICVAAIIAALAYVKRQTRTKVDKTRMY